VVDILMATYNGEHYLVEQIESILEQDYSDWRILVRDDCSTDRTMDILTQYARSIGEDRFIVLDNNGLHLGCTGSFEVLIESSSSEYLMLCDQDDYWLPDKMSSELLALSKLEAKYPNVPCMVFSDLFVTDEELKVSTTLWNILGFVSSNKFDWRKNLALNVVSGCTIVINHEARSLLLPFPSVETSHDVWIACCVGRFGVVTSLSKPTMFYRQHGSNLIGSTYFSLGYLTKKVIHLRSVLRSTIEICKRLGDGSDLLTVLISKIYLNFRRLVRFLLVSALDGSNDRK